MADIDSSGDALLRVCICDECARLCGGILDEAEDSGHEEEKNTEHTEVGKSRE